MAKQIKKIEKPSPLPAKVQLTEVEMLRIHNAVLKLRQAQIEAQHLNNAVNAEREAASKRVGVDIMHYEFTDDGVGVLRR